MTMNVHIFKPSDPDGTVCVARAAEDYDADICDKPADHPIHTQPLGRGQGRGHSSQCRAALFAGTQYAQDWPTDPERCDLACRQQDEITPEAYDNPGPMTLTSSGARKLARRAVLADVTKLRAEFSSLPVNADILDRLDRIEAYIQRGGGR